ncbi:MAG: phosphohydrolase, partial [Chloroflexi bacterium]|nr:phosphohydrolase [Chloroflexota bacterium]
AGEDIPLGARIISVADAFQAMISDRPYRNALTVDKAVGEIGKCSGKQFDPNVVGAFLRVVEERYFRQPGSALGVDDTPVLSGSG